MAFHWLKIFVRCYATVRMDFTNTFGEVTIKPLIFLGLFLILVVFTVLTFQKDDQSNPVLPQTQPSKEISLYHYFSGSFGGGIQEMIDQINKRNHGEQVTIHALDHEAFKSMIHYTISNGNPPELFTYWAGAKTQALVDQNQLEPFDDLWQEISVKGQFTPAIVEAASTYNGKKYLLPITQHLVVFFYNKKLLAREKLSPPSSWPEFLLFCQTLKERGLPAIALGARERWPAQFWFDYLLLRTAGPEYRSALMQGKASYLDPEVIEAYRIWAEMLGKGYFNQNANTIDWVEATEMVCRGDAAVTLMGTWAIQLFTSKPCNAEEGVDLDYFTFPVINKGVVDSLLGPIDGIVLTRESTYHEFAKTVLAYFAETRPQEFMSSGSGALAPSQKVPREFYSPLKQRLLNEIKKSSNWAFNYDLATPTPVAEEGLDSFNELIAYPEQYKNILKDLDQETTALFAKKKSNPF